MNLNMIVAHKYLHKKQKTITLNSRNRGKNKKCQTRQLLYPTGTRAETALEHNHQYMRPCNICIPHKVKVIKELMSVLLKREVIPLARVVQKPNIYDRERIIIKLLSPQVEFISLAAKVHPQQSLFLYIGKIFQHNIFSLAEHSQAEVKDPQ